MSCWRVYTEKVKRRWQTTITNLRFADDIDGLAGEEEELANLVERLDKASTAYSMEISKVQLSLVSHAGVNPVEFS